MCQQFDSMRAASTDIIIACVKDPKCVYVKESLQEDTVKVTDSEEEIPSGEEVLQRLFPRKQYNSAVRDHIISLFQPYC